MHFETDLDSDVTIRPVRAGDAFGLLQMLRQLAASCGETARIGMDQITRDCCGSDRWLNVLVAQNANGQLIGFASYAPLSNMKSGARGIDLYHFYVTPQARGEGIGSLLLETVEIEAQRHGAMYLRLTSAFEALEKRGLYRAI